MRLKNAQQIVFEDRRKETKERRKDHRYQHQIRPEEISNRKNLALFLLRVRRVHDPWRLVYVGTVRLPLPSIPSKSKWKARKRRERCHLLVRGPYRSCQHSYPGAATSIPRLLVPIAAPILGLTILFRSYLYQSLRVFSHRCLGLACLFPLLSPFHRTL